MKIAFFTDTYFPDLNGVSISVDNFARELRKKGHTVYIFAPKVSGNYKDKDKFLIRLPSLKILSKVEPQIYTPTLWPNKQFREMFKENFDLIHAHGNGPYSLLGYFVSKIKRIPFVMTFHTIHTHYTHYIFKGKVITPKMVSVGLKTFAQRCNLVLVPSEKMKNELISYGVNKQIFVSPNFLDEERFKITNPNFLHHLLNLPKDTPLILTVGRIGKEKNLDFILRVFKLVAQKDKKSHLVVVGKGPESDNLKALSKALGIEKRVHFTGGIDYKLMPLVYKSASVFVFASITETQGLSVLEAAVCALPIVVNNDEAFANIAQDGKNAFVLDLNENLFAGKILDLLADKNLREKMGKTSQKIAKVNFNSDKIVSDLTDIYSSLSEKMRKVRVVAKTEKSPEDFWEKIIDVKNWDNVIKFVKKVETEGSVAEKNSFHDVTAILWVPVKVRHHVTKIVPYEKFYMEAHMPFSTGIMYQNIDIKRGQNVTEVILEIKFDVFSPALDLIFGPILEKRLKLMLTETLKELREELGGEIITK